MNPQLKLVHNAMLDNQIIGLVRSQPTVNITKAEVDRNFDDIEEAFMDYAKGLGYDVTIHSVERIKRDDEVLCNVRLATLRIAVYRAICTHGMAETNDETLRDLLPEPKSYVKPTATD